MNKLSIAALVAGTAAVTGFVVSKILKNKKKESDSDIFDESYDGCCCDPSACEDDLDVVIPAEETDDCAETVKEDVEKAVEDVNETAEDADEEVKD